MSSLDSDGFFIKSVMCYTFKTSRKEPDPKDKLTMFVMGVSNTSGQDFNNLVGNGSRSQDLSWEETINFLTWFERCHWKINFWWWDMRYIVFRIAQFHYFLFTKKVEKLWQSVVISLVVGIDVVGTRCSSLPS